MSITQPECVFVALVIQPECVFVALVIQPECVFVALVIQPECVFAALVIQHAMGMRHIRLWSVSLHNIFPHFLIN